MIVRPTMRWLRRILGSEPPHLAAGRWGEDEAERFLAGKGWKILGRRVRVGRKDELDLVARADGVLVFVEVKTRQSEAFGRPFDSVDRAKRRFLSRAAFRYLMRLKEKPDYFRFDVVEVIGRPGEGTPTIRHIENAFAMDRRYRLPW